MKQKAFLPMLALIVVLSLGFGLSSCSSSKQRKGRSAREIAQHTEKTGAASTVTKIIEEQQDGVTILRVQVFKEGKMEESIYYLEGDNFSISIPVGAGVQAAATEDTGKSTHAKVLLFSQRLEQARAAMVKADYINALEAVNQALQIDNYNPQAHMMKGSIFYAMGKTELAKKEFDYVIKLEPNNQEVKRFKKFLDSKAPEHKKIKIENNKK